MKGTRAFCVAKAVVIRRHWRALGAVALLLGLASQTAGAFWSGSSAPDTATSNTSWTPTQWMHGDRVYGVSVAQLPDGRVFAR